MNVKGIPIAHLLSLTPEVQSSTAFQTAIATFDANRVVDTSPELTNPESIYPSTKKDVLIKALSWMVDYEINQLPFKIKEEVEELIVMMLENAMLLCNNITEVSNQTLRDINNPKVDKIEGTIELTYSNRIFIIKEEKPWWYSRITFPVIPPSTLDIETDYSGGIWSGYIDSWNKTNVPLFQEPVLVERMQYHKKLEIQYAPKGDPLNLHQDSMQSNYVSKTYPFYFNFLDYTAIYDQLMMKFKDIRIEPAAIFSGDNETSNFFTEVYSERKLELLADTEQPSAVIVLAEPTILETIKSINLMSGEYRYVNNV